MQLSTFLYHSTLNSNLSKFQTNYKSIAFRKYGTSDIAIWAISSNEDIDAIRFYSGGINLSHSSDGGVNWTSVMDTSVTSIALGSTNGKQNWGSIYKSGRICFLSISGYPSSKFYDNTAYEISNIPSSFVPIDTKPLTSVQGDWVNSGLTNVIEVSFIDLGNGNYSMKLTPIKGDIEIGDYISFSLSYISNS